jgi:hypothetical protein
MRARATIAWRASVCFAGVLAKCVVLSASPRRSATGHWTRPPRVGNDGYLCIARTPRGRCAAVPQLEARL